MPPSDGGKTNCSRNKDGYICWICCPSKTFVQKQEISTTTGQIAQKHDMGFNGPQRTILKVVGDPSLLTFSAASLSG